MLFIKKSNLYLCYQNETSITIKNLNIMKLTVNTSSTIQELTNEAIAFSKYSNDAEAMEYLNEVLTELSFKMSSGNFQVFKERINTMLNA